MRGAARHRAPGRASTDASQGHAPSFGHSACLLLIVVPWKLEARQQAEESGQQKGSGGDMAGEVPRCQDAAVCNIGLLQGSQAPSRMGAQCHKASSPSSSAIRGAGCTTITRSLGKEAAVAKSFATHFATAAGARCQERVPATGSGTQALGVRKASKISQCYLKPEPSNCNKR